MQVADYDASSFKSIFSWGDSIPAEYFSFKMLKRHLHSRTGRLPLICKKTIDTEEMSANASFALGNDSEITQLEISDKQLSGIKILRPFTADESSLPQFFYSRAVIFVLDSEDDLKEAFSSTTLPS